MGKISKSLVGDKLDLIDRLHLKLLDWETPAQRKKADALYYRLLAAEQEGKYEDLDYIRRIAYTCVISDYQPEWKSKLQVALWEYSNKYE